MYPIILKVSMLGNVIQQHWKYTMGFYFFKILWLMCSTWKVHSYSILSPKFQIHLTSNGWVLPLSMFAVINFVMLQNIQLAIGLKLWCNILNLGSLFYSDLLNPWLKYYVCKVLNPHPLPPPMVNSYSRGIWYFVPLISTTCKTIFNIYHLYPNLWYFLVEVIKLTN